jgi:hypothetical protein
MTFAFAPRSSRRFAGLAALLVLAVGCYGTPRSGDPETGGTGDGRGGTGGIGTAGGTGTAGALAGASGNIGGSRGGTAGNLTGAGGSAGGSTATAGSLGTGGSAGAGSAGNTATAGSLGTAGSAAVGGAGTAGNTAAAGSVGTAGSAGAGSGGRGGSKGSKILGQNCTVDQECGSEHCAGNVCCDQACTGTCQQCSATGHCQAPADDPMCGVISCPADTTCRDYEASITTKRCKGLGQCKTGNDCAYVDAPKTRACGFVRQMTELAQAMCDGMGNCTGPTVKCGGDGDCSIQDSYCCGTAGGLACGKNACGDFAPRPGPFLCDERADCAAGYVCCFQVTPGGTDSSCIAAELCKSDAASFRREACNPAATPGECTTGTCQSDPNAPIGWSTCK